VERDEWRHGKAAKIAPRSRAAPAASACKRLLGGSLKVFSVLACVRLLNAVHWACAVLVSSLLRVV
jgi:hypothetical protein